MSLENFVHWDHVYGPCIPKNGHSKGAFHLHFDPFEMDKIWKKICQLTTTGRLGYMCSVSPNAMSFGRFIGDFTISIHVMHSQRHKVWDALNHYDLTYAMMSYKEKHKHGLEFRKIKMEPYFNANFY